MDHIGSWGIDIEIFLAAQILKTDIFVYQDNFQSWNKFSGYGFVNKHNGHDQTEKKNIHEVGLGSLSAYSQS